MSHLKPAVGQYVLLPKTELGNLVVTLKNEGYTVIGPRLRDGVIAMLPVDSAADLASAVADEQAPGSYRTKPTDSAALFHHVVGPDSPKRYLFPPQLQLFKLRTQTGAGGFAVESGPPAPPKLAMIGIRPCDLAALRVHDTVFRDLNRCESDTYYTRTRQQMFTVAVNCTRPGGTCFCNSMGTGPAAKDGFDLAMTELRAGFVVRIGSARGVRIAGALDIREPSAAELELAELRLEQAREHMGRKLDPTQARDVLSTGIEHPHWDDVAKRCLACGNCTMVCPTCFCSAVSDSNDLSGGGVARTRTWDSCFNHQFSYTTSGPVRSSIRARYRHWLRHKLCTWWDQFDTCGCVGCGRCITWCPAKIDLTQEVAAIAAASSPNVPHPAERALGGDLVA